MSARWIKVGQLLQRHSTPDDPQPLEAVLTSASEATRRALVNRDISFTGDDQETALHVAAKHGKLNIVKWLVAAAGAKVDARDVLGRTPLHLAVAANHTPIVRYLIEDAGADVEGRSSSNGRTPFRAACSSGNIELVKYLAEAGANLEVATEAGWRPLHTAVSENKETVVLYLLSQEVTRTARTRKHAGGVPAGSTPADIARRFGFKSLATILELDDADLMTVMHAAGNAVKRLVDHEQEDTPAAGTGYLPPISPAMTPPHVCK